MSAEDDAKAEESVQQQNLMQHFLKKAQLPKDFPTDLASLKLLEKQQYKDNMIVDVEFDEMRGYNVNLAVFAVVNHGRLQNLKRCSHLNGRVVEVFKSDTVCVSEELGVCSDEGACKFKIMLEVRLVTDDEKPKGKFLRIDGVHVVPLLTPNYAASLDILRGMATMWTEDTPVILQFQKTQVDIMRLSVEFFAKDDETDLQTDVCQVVSASYVVQLSELVAYMGNEANWNDTQAAEVSVAVKSFVTARLSGFHLNDECVLCFEPLRHLPQVRLGCACGAAGSVKGRVLHLKCANVWLGEQANIWRDGYHAEDRAPLAGPDGPTCPVCIQRLEGIPPRVTDLRVGVQAPVGGVAVVKVINIPDDDMTFDLYEQMDRKVMNVPMTLTRILHGEATTVRVDETMMCGIITYQKCVLFPSAEHLFACSGHETQRECDFPGPASGVASNEDLLVMGVEKYNNKVYYAALGCWLRWTRQFLRNGTAQA